MGNHGKYGATRGVRWDATLGEFVMKCNDCSSWHKQAFWPITLDFWNPRTLQRCRACDVAARARHDRERRKRDKGYAERRKAQNREYWRKNRDVLLAKRRISAKKEVTDHA